MSETGEGPKVVLPPYVGAVFMQGRNAPLAQERFYDRTTGDYKAEFVQPALDVTKKESRFMFGLENIKVFSDGTLGQPELQWKSVVDNWLQDLRFAAERANLSVRDRKETEENIKAMMAVSSSARAMEASDGSAEKYAMAIAPGREGVDTDKQDDWADFLLAKDPKKLVRVVNMPLVKEFYIKILTDAGMDVPPEWPSEGVGDYKSLDAVQINSSNTVEVSNARNGKLAEYLKDSGKNGGLDDYIQEELLDATGNTDYYAGKYGLRKASVWAAAKLAADAFMVDKYTRWEYAITGEGKTTDTLRLKPYSGWGGDPFRATLEPSFLPRHIKGVYHEGSDRIILDMIDNAFRPNDIFDPINKPKRSRDAVRPTAVENLKKYHRWNQALWMFFGGSRVASISQWNRDALEKTLPSIPELLDQVYGSESGIEHIPTEDPHGTGDRIGDHIVGVMVARMLETKALAATLESAKPGVRQKVGIVFDGAVENRTFGEALKYLWGPDLDARQGYLVSLTGGRTRLVLKDNKFGAAEHLKNTYSLLYYNSQDPKERRRLDGLNYLGFVIDILRSPGEVRVRR